ncbi:CAP domain-containing protein [Taibaiella koreensis]|uniref:CAP domain-containing protein n=1 Tax=Taibaiella koreensis TaxID=1268548 RepID=UPI000E599109|nr:CAP domain-containing protein [Taibaiella koreensis]
MQTILRSFVLLICLSLLTVSDTFAGSLIDDILRYTNEYRQSKGKPPLELDNEASDQAEAHSRDMAKGRNGFGHEGFNDRVKAVSNSVGKVSAAAENVAYGDMNARQVVDGWIKSKGHRKNMLGDYNLIGIGVAKGRDGALYFTQLFIRH